VIKKNNFKLIIISIMILGVLLLLLLNGCFLLPRYGSVEGHVYVPESPTEGKSIILRDSPQAPAGYKPLVGATVGVEGSSNTTTTDIYGYFILIDISIGTIIINITPPSGSGYQPLIISVEVILDSIVDIGNDGSVSLPSENADYWDVTINRIDTSNWPEVRVYVQVIDPINNSPIIGANDFEVDISGNKIGDLTVTQYGATSASPSSSSLVIDRSGSMSGTELSDAKEAAKTFVGFMTANDRAEVVSFSNNVRVDQEFTNDKSALDNAIDSITTYNMTALYDGIWKGLDDTALETNERKAVIALTDGKENYSSSEHGGGNPPDNSLVINHAQGLNIPVYTIGLGLSKGITVEEGVRISRDFDPTEDLRQIAEDTGGEFFDAPTSTDLEYIYVQITQRIQQQYIITFTDNTGITSGILTVKLNYNQLYGEDTKEYNPLTQEYENKVEVYGTSLLDVQEDHKTDAEITGKKYWGSIGTKKGEYVEKGKKWYKVEWDNDENVSGSADPDNNYKPESGWSDADFLWDYDPDERVRGVDISQGNKIEDWRKIYNSGRRFAIIKVSEGIYTSNEKLIDYITGINNLKEDDFYIGLYHLIRPNLYPDGAINEAQHFLTELSNAGINLKEGEYLRPFIDLEADSANHFIENEKTEDLIKWIDDWAAKVKDELNLDENPILYCSQSTATDLCKKKEDADSITKYPLWIADWTNNNNENTPTYAAWSEWAFRQYAGALNPELAGRARCPGFAVNAGVDLDIYNGDIGELESNFLIK